MLATCLYISKTQKDYPVFRMVFFHDDERLLIRADKKSLENKIEIFSDKESIPAKCLVKDPPLLLVKKNSA